MTITMAGPADTMTAADGSLCSLREQLVRVWARALFCSPLRPSDRPDSDTVCLAVAVQLAAYAHVPGGILGRVAQEAGDYPVGFDKRMAWCQRTADLAYTVLFAKALPHQATPPVSTPHSSDASDFSRLPPPAG